MTHKEIADYAREIACAVHDVSDGEFAPSMEDGIQFMIDFKSNEENGMSDAELEAECDLIDAAGRTLYFRFVYERHLARLAQ